MVDPQMEWRHWGEHSIQVLEDPSHLIQHWSCMFWLAKHLGGANYFRCHLTILVEVPLRHFMALPLRHRQVYGCNETFKLLDKLESYDTNRSEAIGYLDVDVRQAIFPQGGKWQFVASKKTRGNDLSKLWDKLGQIGRVSSNMDETWMIE